SGVAKPSSIRSSVIAATVANSGRSFSCGYVWDWWSSPANARCTSAFEYVPPEPPHPAAIAATRRSGASLRVTAQPLHVGLPAVDHATARSALLRSGASHAPRVRGSDTRG